MLPNLMVARVHVQMEKNYRADRDGDDTTPARDNTNYPALSRDADRITIGDFAREAGVTLRALRFYQSKGLLAPQRNGNARIFSGDDRDRLVLIQQGKRLGFTLSEIRDMLAARARARGCDKTLPVSRKKCVEQIKLLEHQRRDTELALAELRQIYTGKFITSDISRSAGAPAAEAHAKTA
jgi:DNA-binding transcriptional MerR regulator